jgi:AraC family transcriptional regulator, transcriptional activator of pobA
MKTVTSITDYCREINVSRPRYPFFDIRRFEDNMKTVNARQAPFRHEFYALALRHSGSNKEVMGLPLQSQLFFNSPYQVITWDILPDWTGYYIIFDREFVGSNPAWQNFVVEFPFFRLDKYIPFDLPEQDRLFADNLFARIFEEYHSDNADKFAFIQTYTQLLLHLTKRYFLKLNVDDEGGQENRTADILLVARFQSMVESMISHEDGEGEVRQPSFYADKLNVHPNHLNAVVKRISGKTASAIIQQHLITAAKSLLRQTTLSIKEISFRMHFTEPTHFNAFFRKHTGSTPQQFRDSVVMNAG